MDQMRCSAGNGLAAILNIRSLLAESAPMIKTLTLCGTKNEVDSIPIHTNRELTTLSMFNYFDCLTNFNFNHSIIQ